MEVKKFEYSKLGTAVPVDTQEIKGHFCAVQLSKDNTDTDGIVGKIACGTGSDKVMNSIAVGCAGTRPAESMGGINELIGKKVIGYVFDLSCSPIAD